MPYDFHRGFYEHIQSLSDELAEKMKSLPSTLRECRALLRELVVLLSRL